MAKSKRSKRKRKLRAVKRKKNEPKELARLVKTIGADSGKMLIQDVVMSDLVTVTDASAVKEKLQQERNISSDPGAEMEVSEPPSKFSRRTLRDEHGQYPAWMNQRAIQKRKTSVRNARGKVTRGKKGGTRHR